jgi:hypothetical protein
VNEKTGEVSVRWSPPWEQVRELQFRPSELLLLEAGSRGTGIVREPSVRGTSAVESRYQALTSGEDTSVCVK